MGSLEREGVKQDCGGENELFSNFMRQSGASPGQTMWGGHGERVEREPILGSGG